MVNKLNSANKQIIIFILILCFIFITGASGCQQLQGPPSGPRCNAPAGEWIPQQGECPGTTADMKAKCDAFCLKYPDCCGKENESTFGGQQAFDLPEESEIAQLKRVYPTTIKAINEGPNMYGQGKNELISDETIDKMKDSGFNTVQMLVIDSQEGDKYYIVGDSQSILLNDIVRIKKKGMAVWIALEYVNAPPGSDEKLEPYTSFKPAYIAFCKEMGELFEKYKVEYFTVNNEPDLFLQEQTQWGTEEEIDKMVQEMFVQANIAAKEKFNGKMINKITQTKKRPQETLDASFKNIDIASVDVGPPASEAMGLETYRSEFEEYQFYASQAEKAGVPWMVGEYWTYNYFEEANDYVKSNQLILAEFSFDAYLKVIPKGVGYSWNDFTSFSLPQGEQTRQALKEFLGGI